MKFTIDTAALAGALKIAPKDDIRYYLNGVLVEFDTRTIVATNNHCLIAIKDAIADVAPEDEAQAPVIIPREFAESVVKAAKKGGKKVSHECRMIALPLDLAGEVISLTWDNCTQSAKVIDGKFPEWRRIVPAKVTLEPMQFNPDILAQMKAAFSEANGGDFPVLHSNGTGAAVMSCRNANILGVVMGWQRDHEPQARPDCLSVAHGAPAEVPAEETQDT